MNQLPQFTSRLFNRPLAISPADLAPMVAYVNRRLAGDQPSAAVEVEVNKTAVEAYSTTDGICVIPVVGTLVHKSSWIDAYCGFRGYSELENDLLEAADSDCRGILLVFDSPGGECSGLFALADVLADVAAKKPIFGVVNDMACSAAYLIAAHCEQLYISETSCVGSIGVIAQHLDQSGWDKQIGLKYTAIFAGERKNDGTPHAPLADPAREKIQAEVDRIYGLFTSRVAEYRQVSIESVMAQQAQIFTAQDAIDAGLADQFGSPDDAYQALLDRVSPAPISATGAAARSTKEQSMKRVGTAATAQSNKPAAVVEETKQDVKGTCDEEQTDDPPAEQAVTKGSGEASQDQVETKDEKGETKSNAVAEEIAALCSIAGKPALTAQYIINGNTLAEVRKDLLAAAKTSHTVHSAINADTGTKAFNAFDSSANPMLAEAQRRAAAAKKETR